MSVNIKYQLQYQPPVLNISTVRVAVHIIYTVIITPFTDFIIYIYKQNTLYCVH